MTGGKGETFDHHRGPRPLLRKTGFWRTALFLSVNLVGFAIVNAFWQYLATGRWLNFTVEAYYGDLRTPLGQMLTEPLNVLTHPWLIVVTGSLLAMIVFVPIIVAVLYRLAFAALFVGIVAVVGHAPVLAVALAISCFLAARTPLRSDAPFLALLLGLAPPAVYFYIFALAGTDSPAAEPLQRWALVAPPALALLLATLSGVVVLALVRLTRFRPGAVWPVLAVLLAGPLAVFYTQIGADELDFSLISRRLAGATLFRPVPLDVWARRANAEGLSGEKLLNRVRSDLQTRQSALSADCEQFVARHGDSHRAPQALWIQATCLSLDVSVAAFAQGRVEYEAAGALRGAEPTWRRLVDDYGATVQGALARYRLAELDLRAGRIDDAERGLAQAVELLAGHLGPSADAGRSGQMFRRPPPIPSASWQEQVRFDAELLLWTIDQNELRGDPAAAEAMAAYLSVDRAKLSTEQYRRRLSQLAGRYERTPLGENFKLAFVLTGSDLNERAEGLLLLGRQRGDIDAAIRANYELGKLALRAPVLQLRPEMETARVYFRRVIQAPPNPWSRAAERHLAWLDEGDDR